MLKRIGVLKEFGPEGMKVTEEVAKEPSLSAYAVSCGERQGTFCLRIDADEYSSDSFAAYYPLFKKYNEAITIFFNAYSFREAKKEILICQDLGVDVQSHAFYHHTYNDYSSNRYNIKKAKEFFLDLGIETKGFTAPYGRWNPTLMRALEEEGYEYSSDFSYDYMGFPSYPVLGGRRALVMEIPIFPVAPELFFQKRNCNIDDVKKYYFKAIDEMVRCNLPVIIYAHTSLQYSEIPRLLEEITEYAVSLKKLVPTNMTDIHSWCKNSFGSRDELSYNDVSSPKIGSDILGSKAIISLFDGIKDFVKETIDFERVTPLDELKCGRIKKMIKSVARNFLDRNPQ